MHSRLPQTSCSHPQPELRHLMPVHCPPMQTVDLMVFGDSITESFRGTAFGIPQPKFEANKAAWDTLVTSKYSNLVFSIAGASWLSCWQKVPAQTAVLICRWVGPAACSGSCTARLLEPLVALVCACMHRQHVLLLGSGATRLSAYQSYVPALSCAAASMPCCLPFLFSPVIHLSAGVG